LLIRHDGGRVMALRPDIIPTTILNAAKRAGLSTPDWYVGRINGHEAHEPEVTLESIVEQVKQKDSTDQGEGEKPQSVD
jgi:hypothetical protein